MTYNYSVDRVLKKIAEAKGKIGKSNVSSFLGTEFEHFIAESFAVGPLANSVSGFATSTILNMLSMFNMK